MTFSRAFSVMIFSAISERKHKTTRGGTVLYNHTPAQAGLSYIAVGDILAIMFL